MILIHFLYNSLPTIMRAYGPSFFKQQIMAQFMSGKDLKQEFAIAK